MGRELKFLGACSNSKFIVFGLGRKQMRERTRKIDRNFKKNGAGNKQAPFIAGHSERRIYFDGNRTATWNLHRGLHDGSTFATVVQGLVKRKIAVGRSSELFMAKFGKVQGTQMANDLPLSCPVLAYMQQYPFSTSDETSQHMGRYSFSALM